MFRRVLTHVLLVAFILTNGMPSVYPQQAIELPAPGTRLELSPAFNPPLLKGIKVYRNDPFRFDFILADGDSTQTNEQLKADSNRLIKYFLASLTVPEKDLWVNLSPYEKDRIVPQAFGETEMGRDLLAQDYILKQITASIIYPENKVGKEFWDKVYAEAQKRFGSTDVPLDTFNKVWIIPEKATVYRNNDAAYVVEGKLKVMLEEDYLALKNNGDMANTNKLSSDIVRDIVIPVLEKEVNEGKNFAPLRQVYYSLILATWYKRELKASLLGQAYVDRQKITGIDIANKNEKEDIWQRYVEAFQKGAYNIIKEQYDASTRQTLPRKYFSGGASFDAAQLNKALIFTHDSAMLPQTGVFSMQVLAVSLRPLTPDLAMSNKVRNPLQILDLPEGQQLALRWIKAFPNEGQDDNTAISQILDFLKDPENRTVNLIADVIKRFSILDAMHARYKLKTQPNTKLPPFELPAVVGKETLLRHLVKGPNLLNVGAGMSLFEERSLQYNPSVINAIGVDIEAQRKIPVSVPEGKTYNFKLMNNPSVIPVENGWANTAIATFVLHHVEVDRLEYLREVSRTLAPGASFLVVEDTFSNTLPVMTTEEMDKDREEIYQAFMHLPSDENRIEFLHFVDWFVHNFVNRSRAPLVPGNYESMETWEGIFREAGFVVKEARNLGFSQLGSRNPVCRGIFVLEKPDTAMESLPSSGMKGGIDFNPGGLDLHSKSDNRTFNVDAAMLQQMQNASGMTPVIVRVQELRSLPEFLGAPSS